MTRSSTTRPGDAWLVWMTFLYKAANQPAYARLHDELMQGWLGRFRRLLADAQIMGEIDADLDIDAEAKALWAYSAGIGQLGLLDAKRLATGNAKTTHFRVSRQDTKAIAAR